MRKNIATELQGPMDVIERFFEHIPGAEKVLSNTEISMGLASDPRFQIPASALDHPIYVGDAAHVADADQIIASAEVRALIKSKGLSAVDTGFIRDTSLRHGKYPNGKYRLVAGKRGKMVVDGIVDAAPALLAGQQYSPWNVGYFQKVFKAPLLYSKALDLVKMESGSEPWCEIMDLFMADYLGFASLEDTGALSNNAVRNINVKAGLMSTPVINISSSYDLSIEEMKRAEQSGSPFGSQLITVKQRYADYVLRMLVAYLIYFGNTNTETVGLLNVPTSITSYSGSSMNALFVGASATPGALQLQALQKIVVPFLTTVYNKINTLKMVMSPTCYNALTAPYSTSFSAEAAIKAFLANFLAGKTKDGGVPNIEIVIEPMFAPSTMFNSNTYDYFMLIATEMEVGPDEEMAPLIMCGAPLMEFVYSTIPGSYDTQYKFLKRFAGIFAPIGGQSVAVWTGFGTQGVGN